MQTCSGPDEGSEDKEEASSPSARSEPAPASPPASQWSVLAVFTVTTFLSASLLFAVQPMFARLVLPILGGAPSVWAVAMLFFQAALLAGYCYAHLLIRLLPVAWTGIVHLAVCALAVLFLPIALPHGMGDPPVGDPALWQLKLFAVGVGLPFFAVAANAPLLQAWFAASRHPHANDPYFLYGASNLGSLLVLLAYPLVLEPAFGVTALTWVWTVGFVVLVGFICLSLWSRARSASMIAGTVGAGARRVTDAAPFKGNEAPATQITTPPPSLARRLGWIGLAFVPSALLTAFTNHITMDVASAPLLWVLPLALYLLTFVLVFRDPPIAVVPSAILIALVATACIAFAAEVFERTAVTMSSATFLGILVALACVLAGRRLAVSGVRMMSAVHIATLVLALLALSQTEHEGWFVTASTGVAVFFASTMVAHRTLYERRPAASRLTEFYLLMSLGGVLGGLFSALIAPRIFSQIYEYPILLALTVACRPGALSLRSEKSRTEGLLSLWVIVAASILALLWTPYLLDLLQPAGADQIPRNVWWLRGLLTAYNDVRIAALEWGATAVLALVFAVSIALAWRHPARQLACAVAMCATVLLLPSGVHRSDAQRSYFGVYRAYKSDAFNILTHGTTLHGAQRMRDQWGNPAPDTTPGTYYYPGSPMAQSVIATRKVMAARAPRFGIIGLGAGSLACLAEKGERWRFFEIDPLMVRIASDPVNFTFLQSCQPSPPDIVIGDARLTLAREPDGAFDLIIVDAFTSDAVPIHLMTAEALGLYLAKTSERGAVVLHISNRYLDLDAVVAATARHVPNAHGILITDHNASGGYDETSSTIALFAKSEEALAPYRAIEGGHPLEAGTVRAWTDDHSDIIGPFMSRLRQ
ncbi:MAG: fused MFS/spermidine synthase [Hyphomicrobiaceae bacterium]